MPTLQRAGDQAQVEPSWASLAKKRHSLVIRAHATGQPAIAESCGIEERPHVRFAIFRLKKIRGREAPCLVCPARKWCSLQVMLNLFQRGSRRPYTLPLGQHNRMIDIIDAIQWRKSAETEVPIGPEHGKLDPQSADRAAAWLRTRSSACRGSPASV